MAGKIGGFPEIPPFFNYRIESNRRYVPKNSIIGNMSYRQILFPTRDSCLIISCVGPGLLIYLIDFVMPYTDISYLLTP